MMRKDSRTGDIYYINEKGERIHLPTTRGKLSTRLKWPAKSPDLRIRYCSAAVKIDVFRRVLNNDTRFQGTKDNPKKILVCTGERREESPQRSRYLEAEIHACSNQSGRIVHAYRPVINWTERDIWDQFEKRSFMPFVAYLLGWNRTSCFSCIFSTPDLWAMYRYIAPERFNRLVEIEKEIGHTIDPKYSLTEMADRGKLDRLPKGEQLNRYVEMALNRNITKDDLIMEKWVLPAGAFRGHAGGPV
jgi:3'-phosphoadenosine 5'-phosphosulfate sulfotransferase (PAPS reductase)/FAD synthetase